MFDIYIYINNIYIIYLQSIRNFSCFFHHEATIVGMLSFRVIHPGRPSGVASESAGCQAMLEAGDLNVEIFRG